MKIFVVLLLVLVSFQDKGPRTGSQECPVVDGVKAEVAEPGEMVTTLQYKTAAGEPHYLVIPLSEYVFNTSVEDPCKSVNVIRGEDGKVRFAESQPKGCTILHLVPVPASQDSNDRERGMYKRDPINKNPKP